MISFLRKKKCEYFVTSYSLQSLKITQFSPNKNDSRMKLETDDKDKIEIQN